MATITLTPEHGYVFVVAGVLAFTHMLLGGVVGSARSRAFGKDFKNKPAVKAMAEEHKKAFPTQKFCPDGAAAAHTRCTLSAVSGTILQRRMCRASAGKQRQCGHRWPRCCMVAWSPLSPPLLRRPQLTPVGRLPGYGQRQVRGAADVRGTYEAEQLRRDAACLRCAPRLCTPPEQFAMRAAHSALAGTHEGWNAGRLSASSARLSRLCPAITDASAPSPVSQEWVRFNNAQRAHQNAVEQSGYVFALLFGSGVFYPLTSAQLGALAGRPQPACGASSAQR